MSELTKKTIEMRNAVADLEMSTFMKIGFLVLGACTALLLYTDGFRAKASMLELFCIVVFGIACIISGIPSVLLPLRYWNYGIEMKDGGFDYYQPLRKKRFVKYADIRRIVAKAWNEGDGESVTQLLIYTVTVKARLDERIMYGTRILDELEALHGFRKENWPEAYTVEGSLKWSFVSKDTVLFEL